MGLMFRLVSVSPNYMFLSGKDRSLLVFHLFTCFTLFWSRGPKDLKNDTGSVNFSKPFWVTPPPPPPSKMGYVRPKMVIPRKTYSIFNVQDMYLLLSKPYSLFQPRVVLTTPIFRRTCEIEASHMKLVQQHKYYIRILAEKNIVHTQDVSQPSYPQRRAVFEPTTCS